MRECPGALLRVVACMVSVRSDIDDFERFLVAFPRLLDKELPFPHRQRERMLSLAARTAWVEPHELPMPA